MKELAVNAAATRDRRIHIMARRSKRRMDQNTGYTHANQTSKKKSFSRFLG